MSHAFQALAPSSPLVTQGRFAPEGGASSRDGPPAKRAPARHSRRRGSNPGSAVCRASGAGWPPCSPCDTAVWRSNADGAGCVGQDQTPPRSVDTSVVCAVSSACPLIDANDRQLPPARPKKTPAARDEGRRRNNRRKRPKENPGEKKTKNTSYIFTPPVYLQFQNGAETWRCSDETCEA